MSEAVVTALITGGLALIGVIFTNLMSNRKIENQLKDFEELKEEVKKYNTFAERVRVLEEQMKVANHRIDDLEKKNK